MYCMYRFTCSLLGVCDICTERNTGRGPGLTWKLLVAWACVLVLCLVLVARQFHTLADAQLSGTTHSNLLDAVVFIAAGDMAGDKLVDVSITVSVEYTDRQQTCTTCAVIP
jgi:hypothetical protein